MSRRFAPRRGVVLSRAGASGSHHLPWALPRVLQLVPEIKRVDGSVWHAGRARGIVCSRDASSAFIPVRRTSAIAASDAGRRRGNGRSGRPSNDTGRQRQAKRNGTAKACAIGSAPAAGSRQSQKQLARPRGSSLQKSFFDDSCDRPGCYKRFVRERRSPLQRFCSRTCRRALERVQERERRWQEARDLVPPY
jgi:hypothetical protein